MSSRFDEIIDRYHTMCEKYDGIARTGRPSDTIPLWVAGRPVKGSARPPHREDKLVYPGSGQM